VLISVPHVQNEQRSAVTQLHLSVLLRPLPPGGNQAIPAIQIENLQGSPLWHLGSQFTVWEVSTTHNQKMAEVDYADEYTAKLLFLGQG
jgi:hypothetical protein